MALEGFGFAGAVREARRALAEQLAVAISAKQTYTHAAALLNVAACELDKAASTVDRIHD